MRDRDRLDNAQGVAHRREALADLLYPVPDPVDTAESLACFLHRDIAGMGLEALDADRLLARIAHALKPSDWLRERLTQLDAAAAARRRGGR
jgi:hypothetical protein